jgi:hypothetical protein
MGVPTLAVLALGFVCSYASSQLDIAIQSFDAAQLQALALSGSFLQQHDVPVPWMTHPELVGYRRLQLGGQLTISLPQTCKDECPSAESAMLELQEKMLKAIIPHAQTMASLQSNRGIGSDSASMSAAEIKNIMDKMTPMMKDLLQVVFQDLCKNKNSYACMAAHTESCTDAGTPTMGLSPDPVTMVKDYGATLGCLCDVCPGARQAFADMAASVMSSFMGSMASRGSGGTSQSTQQDAMKADVMNAICPLAGMARCFSANPAQCNAVFQGKNGIGGMGVIANVSDPSAFKSECEQAGVSVAAPTMQDVTMKMTIAGLDFAKVNGNTQFKNSLVSAIKAAVIAKLPGYMEEDISVVLTAGSVKAAVSIAPLPGSNAASLVDVANSARASIAEDIVTKVKALPEVTSTLKSGTAVTDLSISTVDPVMESNPDNPVALSAARRSRNIVVSIIGAVLARTIM